VAAMRLESRGLTPVAITAEDNIDIFARLESWYSEQQNIKVNEVIVFTRQLASTLEAGVPLTGGLEAVAEQLHNKKFQSMILSMKREVEEGKSFSETMERYHKAFPPLVVNMVRAGEKSGMMPQVLDRVSNLLEKDMETRAKVVGATRYPMIILGTMVGAFFLLNFFVLPKFASIFDRIGIGLPLPTKILLAINKFTLAYWYLCIIGCVAVVVGFNQILKTKPGRHAWDQLMLKTPVFGPLFVKIYVSRFGRMLSSMLGAGIPVLEALTITAATIENVIVSNIVLNIRNELSHGKRMAEVMKAAKIFPPISVSMVSIGEKSGNLEGMLNKTSDYFDREVNYTIENITPLIEPMLIFGLGGIMLVFALGIFLPMWDMTKMVK